jgi:uncharacterized protein YrzB (UPF0473 family)
MNKKEKSFVENFNRATATEDDIKKYDSLFMKLYDPQGKREEIQKLLKEGNEKIKEAVLLAEETKTPFSFQPYDWGYGFERAFANGKTSEELALFTWVGSLLTKEASKELESIECFASEYDEDEDEPFRWQYWSSSSMSC